VRVAVPDTLIRELTNNMMLWGVRSSKEFDVPPPKEEIKKCGEN
jgi:hypothetical protein